MPQVTLTVPHEKLPILNEVLRSLGIEDKRNKDITTSYSYREASDSVKDSANALFKKYFGWEYFSNELEFE